jgi:hypothetical protein
MAVRRQTTVGPLLAARLAWEAENPRPEPLRRAEETIVRALNDAGFGRQHQHTYAEGFTIDTGEIVVRVELSADG